MDTDEVKNLIKFLCYKHGCYMLKFGINYDSSQDEEFLLNEYHNGNLTIDDIKKDIRQYNVMLGIVL